MRSRIRSSETMLVRPSKQSMMMSPGTTAWWHFELRREADGLVLHAVSTRALEVDGRALTRGDQVPVEAGTTVRVARVVTMTFVSRIPSVGDAATAVPD
jgi:hypothetical protein